MPFPRISRCRLSLGLLALTTLLVTTVTAQIAGTVRGKVLDPLGKTVSQAKVILLQDGKQVAQGTSDAEGSFDLAAPGSGTYSAQVEASGFANQTLAPIFVSDGKTTDLTVQLSVGSLSQQVVVTATGTAIPESQVGASITLIDSQQIQALNKLDVLEELRLVPGAQIMQTSQRGGETSLFLRGGDSDFNKVLIDGIPGNSIGGFFDFAQLSNGGVGSVEVLRGSNSVLYGSDALAGVVSVTSTRGTTTLPQLQYSADGGNFGTYKQDASLGQVIDRFDYFTNFSRYDTRGSFPNDFFHNVTFDGNAGWFPNSTTGARITARNNTTDLGSPNGISFYGIEDDSTQRNKNTYVGGTVQDQTTEQWHNQAQFAFAQFSELYVNPTPTGTFFNSPFEGPVYLGNTVTIRGGNGYSVTGQAILDFGGTYPMIFSDYEGHRSVNLQTDYRFFSNWTGIAGARFEHENGQGFIRNNYSYFLETHGSIAHRLFATAGVGIDKNEVFGLAASPRVSLAYYLRSPLDPGFFGQTKLKFNYGQGIEEPSTSEQSATLIALLTPAQIAQYGVSAIGPQRSRTFDFGIEQGLWNGRAILGVTLFYNRFYDLISFLGVNDLIGIGVPPAVAEATQIGGAYVNADSERALGTEVDFKTDLGHGLLFQGNYTYLDPVTTKAFGAPSFNPLFPTVPIGAFNPLVGARPFRRAPHSGSLGLFYSRNKFDATFSGSLIGSRDDSTSLSDENGGNTMLLPNRNLTPAYQKFDLSFSYSVRPALHLYTSVENLFSQHYEAAFGFPALPFTIRSGLKLTLGGPGGWAIWK
jgi:vitamin B12 transporter